MSLSGSRRVRSRYNPSLPNQGCAVCCRRNVFSYDGQNEICFVPTPPNGFFQGSSLCKISRFSVSSVGYFLCKECKSMITGCVGDQNYKKWKFNWAAFIWKSLNLRENGIVDSTADGGEPHLMRFWEILPLRWRKWWIDACKENIPCFSSLSLHIPEPQFDDDTFNAFRFQDAIKTNTIKSVGCILNKFPVPCVRCPWGCVEYIENTYPLPFDRFLFHCSNFKLVVSESYVCHSLSKKIPSSHNAFNGIRSDYLTLRDNVMDNDSWPIRPTLRIISGAGPCICVCRFHSKGSKTSYVHVPVHPLMGSLASSETNNMAPAVLLPRSIRPMRVNRCSDSYKMVVVDGGYQGIDTCSVTFNRRFDRGNQLSDIGELFSLSLRRDLQNMLDMLISSGDLPLSYKEALKLSMDINQRVFQEALSINDGSTVISIEDAIRLHRATVVDGNADSNGFNPPWPSVVSICEDTITNVPTLPSVINKFIRPVYRNGDWRRMWLYMSLAMNVPELWSVMHELCVKHAGENRHHWCGWLLRYISQDVLTGVQLRFQGRKKMYVKNPNLQQLQWVVNIGDEDCNVPRLPTGGELDSVNTIDMCWKTSVEKLNLLPAVKTFESLQFLDSQFENGFALDNTETNLLVINFPRTNLSSDHFSKYLPFVDGMIPLGFSTDSKRQWWDLVYVGIDLSSSQARNIRSISRFKRKKGTNYCKAVSVKMREPSPEIITLPIQSHRGHDMIDVGEHNLLVFQRKLSTCDGTNQEKYMQYLGKRTTSKCPVHHKPMVVCPRRQKPHCVVHVGSEGFCQNEAVLGCESSWECGWMVCREHEEHVCAHHGLDVPFCPLIPPSSCCIQGTESVQCPLIESFRCSQWDCDWRVCKKHKDHLPLEDDVHCFQQRSQETTKKNQQPEQFIFWEMQPSSGIDGNSEVSSLITDQNLNNEYERNIFSNTNNSGHDSSNLYSNDSEESDLLRCQREEELHAQYESSPYQEGIGIMNDTLPNDKILWTSTADKAYMVDLSSFDAFGNHSRERHMSMHAILNKHFNLLVRRHRPLIPNSAELSFMQRIVAGSDKLPCVPLLYPEGMLFPNIFYNEMEDGSIAGSIPSGLYHKTYFTDKHGFADITSHMRARITNLSLQCSTNPQYLCYAFDVVNNHNLSYINSRFVLRRGFEHMMGGSSLLRSNCQTLSSHDVIDSRTSVQQLAAMIRDEEPTYFYTHTCNQEAHFGVAPIRSWIMDRCDSIEFNSDLSDNDKKASIEALHEQGAMMISRGWLRAGRYLMEYICNSHEKPLGPVKNYWWRWEYQDAKGNVPHIHCLLWTGENKESAIEMDNINKRVSCLSSVFLDEEVQCDLISKGVMMQDMMDAKALDLCDKVRSINSHCCKKVNMRCHRRIGAKDGETQCRYRDYFKLNPSPTCYGYIDIDPHHSNAAMEVMLECGLIQRNVNGQIIYIHPRLRAGLYVYPAKKGEQMSPFNPLLFASTLSSDNIQICDTYFACRYLAKYVQGIDNNTKIHFTESDGDSHGITMNDYQIANTKLSRGFFAERAREKKRGQNESNSGRAIGIPEMIALILHEQQIFTSMHFVKIPTSPLEHRPAFEMKPNFFNNTLPSPNAFQGFSVFNQCLREQRSFPIERLFTSEQLDIVNDNKASPFSIDAVGLFSIRPPELMFVRKLIDYHQWFYHGKLRSPGETESFLQDNLNLDLSRCAWINGLGRQIFIRPHAVQSILHLPDLPTNMRDLLEALQTVRAVEVNWANGESDQHSFVLENHYHLRRLFFGEVDSGKELCFPLPLPVVSPVKPSRVNRFIIQILLSMGEFDTEGTLFRQPSCIQMFKSAKLIEEDCDDMRLCICKIVRRYILEQLVFMPKGTYEFDYYVVAAMKSLYMAIMENMSSPSLAPAFLYTSLIEQANESCKELCRVRRCQLADALSMYRDTPTAKELSSSTKQNPMNWRPVCYPVNGQSNESGAEHAHVNKFFCEKIDRYIQCESTSRSANVVVGGPGAGKTHRMMAVAAYAMAQGLSVITTAFSSDRANVLGGVHIHRLFAIGSSNIKHVNQSADGAMVNLERRKEEQYFLRQLDVLCIDELGNISAQVLETMNVILQQLRNDYSYMGGVIVFSTMDMKQLQPIDGDPCLLSSSVQTSFDMQVLQHSVRAMGDELMKEAIFIARSDTITEGMLSRFEWIIKNHCNHITDWASDSIPADAVRVLGRNRALRYAESVYYNQIQNQGILILERASEDYQTSGAEHGIWNKARNEAVTKLNQYCRDVGLLRIHDGLVVQMTYNHPGHLFSNTQMAYIFKCPSIEELDLWRPMKIMLAPPGVRCLPCMAPAMEVLLAHGWIEITVHAHTNENLVRVSGTLKAKRKQYPIKPSIAITIHAAMGNEYQKVVSSVHGTDTNQFNLWEKEQVLVLISRTKCLKDLFFVGCRNETSRKLAVLLRERSRHEDNLARIANGIMGVSPGPASLILSPTELSVIPRNICTPRECTEGFVYVLISITDKSTMYVGSTSNLKKRLDEHNRGMGAMETANIAFHKWHYLFFVSGFMNRQASYLFERDLQNRLYQGTTPLRCQFICENHMNYFNAGFDTMNQLRLHLCLDLKFSS